MSPFPAEPLPVIGMTLGDPMGVGPEVVLKALADPDIRTTARFVVFGCNASLLLAAEQARIEPFWHRADLNGARVSWPLVHPVVVCDDPWPEFVRPATRQPSRAGGSASIRWLDAAIAAAKRPVAAGGVQAIVTAPICKASWDLAGFGKYPGHTEFLQARTQAKRAVMLFDSPVLRIALATVHEPLMNVGNTLNIGRVLDALESGHAFCQRIGIVTPRIAVCGLNPHAGEGGLFGCEEQRVIGPAIALARHQGMDVQGPFPADTLFTQRQLARFDLFVAMYHDQGLIPLKLLAFDSAVNVTAGLPFIRTSPDHGTAFDIAGKNIADAASMKAAVRLAVRLCAGGGLV